MSDPVTIKQYCSVCKMEFDMSIIPTADGDDDGVVWLQCPNCRGYLPKISNSRDFKTAGDEADKRSAAAEAEIETGDPDPDIVAALLADDDDGILIDPDEAVPARAAAATEPQVDDPSILEDMDIAAGVPYRSWESYQAGDVVHHLAWDDYGVVLAKEVLPGDRKVVKVHFANAGIVRLIEEDGSRP